MKTWTLAGAAVLVGALFVAVLSLPGVSPHVLLVTSNAGQLTAAVLASVACAGAAARTTGRHRAGWRTLSFATAAWAFGQLVWSYFEVVLGQEVPYPSPADAGFLVFPAAAIAGLVMWLGTEGAFFARGRDVLDGAIVAMSLLSLSWVTALGSTVQEGGTDWLSITLSLAYPLGDVVLATLALLALARGEGARRGSLVLLASGLLSLAVADSAYVYLVSISAYSSADLLSVGWIGGFLLVAAGAASECVRPHPQGNPATARSSHSDANRSRLVLLLPYPPLFAATTATCIKMLNAPQPPVIDMMIGVAIVWLVLIRQYLAMTENHRLVIELQHAREKLQHQARHDHLTGLVNRAYFADVLESVLRDGELDVAVLFCDLDDFKRVNDELGHEAGDVLLRRVAERLVSCIRPDDTVARIGGDEFAVLLHHSPDAQSVADRVVAAVLQPYDVFGHEVHTSISVGIADRETLRAACALTEDEQPGAGRFAQMLLRYADTAMYAAKASGKSRAVHADPETLRAPVG